jgi:hypothetical protein
MRQRGVLVCFLFAVRISSIALYHCISLMSNALYVLRRWNWNWNWSTGTGTGTGTALARGKRPSKKNMTDPDGRPTYVVYLIFGWLSRNQPYQPTPFFPLDFFSPESRVQKHRKNMFVTSPCRKTIQKIDKNFDVSFSSIFFGFLAT